jgi:3-hydroxybutyryl-CoA dehydrogenase
MEVNNVAVIGAGNMGHQIALCAAIAGFKVTCTDANADILAKANQFADNYLSERVTKAQKPHRLPVKISISFLV